MFFKSRNYKKSNDTMELVFMAEEFRDKFKFKKSLKPAEKAIQIEPGNYMAWDAKGVAYRHLGRWTKSKKCFEMALELLNRPDVIHFPDKSIPEARVHIFNNYANLLTILQRYEEAINCYTETIGICRKVMAEREKNRKDVHWEMHGQEIKGEYEKIDNMVMAKQFRNLARCYSFKGDKIKAIENNKKSLDYEDRDFVYSNLAQNYFDLQNLLEMENWLRNGINKFPESPFVNFAYAIYYSYKQQFKPEQKALEKVIQYSEGTEYPDLINFRRYGKKRLKELNRMIKEK